jgi:hypothetical protein
VIKLIVFIAGPRAIKRLNNNIEERLYNIYLNNIKVVVGDAAGVDKAVQDYFYRLNYSNVNVYAIQGKARNNVGNWPVVDVEANRRLKGFDYYAAKDVKMAEVADYGFMLEKILLRCDNVTRSLYNSLLNKTEQLSIMEENDAHVKTGRNNWNT